MEMTTLLEEMLPTTPRSPDPEQSSALAEPPELEQPRKVKKVRAKRKLESELDDEYFARPPWRDGDRDEDPEPPMPQLLLSPRRVVQHEVERAGAAGGDKGKGPADEAGTGAVVLPAFPYPTLRLQMRPTKKASMSGGSSAHNVQKPAKLVRTHSVYMPCGATEEIDPEILFAQSELSALASPRKASAVETAGELSALASPRKACAVEKDTQQVSIFFPKLRTPPRSLAVLTVDTEFEIGPHQELAPLDGMKIDFGCDDIDLSQFTMSE